MAAKKRNPNGSGNISQRQDGRYELETFVDSPDGRRKRISVYASTWEDADAEPTRLKDLQRKGIPVDSTTSTVEQYMQYWLTEIARPSVRETTFSSYELLVRLYVVPGLGKRKPRALQAQHIRTWLNGLRTTCQCCAQGKDAERAIGGKARCCAKKPAECCGQVAGTGTLNLALRDVKTESSAATVPLPAELVAILRRHRRNQFGDAQVARANTLGLVFTTKNGTPLEPRNVNRAFETLCRRVGLRSIRLHDLRHSCATLLFAMGVEAATAQRILRHSSSSVTTGRTWT
jgi:integrase